MRLIGAVVLTLAVSTIVVVVVSWISGFYPWEVAVPILFATITGGLLAGTVAWAQSFAIDINAARLEKTIEAESPPPRRGDGEDSAIG